MNGMPALVVITKIHQPEPLPFSEVQGDMLPAYQEFLEKSWIRQLKENTPLKLIRQFSKRSEKSWQMNKTLLLLSLLSFLQDAEASIMI